MDSKKIGELIRGLRLEKNMTQKELAELLCLSDKTVSKWERGYGSPDPVFWSALSEIFGVGIDSILKGDLINNEPIGGNMKKAKYYVCPQCGNLTVSVGSAGVECCGRKMEAVTPKKAEESQKLSVEIIEDDWYITSNHPMTKENHITFIAFATADQIHLYKQYPEWNIQTRIQRRQHGMLLWHSITQGLFYQYI